MVSSGISVSVVSISHEVLSVIISLVDSSVSHGVVVSVDFSKVDVPIS